MQEAFRAHPFSRFTTAPGGRSRPRRARPRDRRHDFIGTEHLALGVLTEPDGLAVKAVEALGVTRNGPPGTDRALLPATVEVPTEGRTSRSRR